MSYIKIEKEKLVNFEYILNKELLRSNRAGAYASSTVAGCNTRKYHGLLVAPLKDGEKHVLLANVNETVIQHDEAFRLGIYKFPGGVFDPHGHRYLREFYSDPIPGLIYRVGGVLLKKEMLLSQNETQMLLRYTLLEANSPTKLRLQPAAAFRNIHKVQRSSMDANTRVHKTDNGIKIKLYENYPKLFIQSSRKSKFVTAPDWLMNVEYQKEQERGYEYTEDLFTPGYFEIDIKKGQSIVFSASVEKAAPGGLNRKFNSEIKKRIPRDTFENNLLNSAQQFFITQKKETLLSAGFPWYGFKYREALIALAGLSLPQGDTKLFEKTLDTIIKHFFKEKEFEGADIPLLLIRAIQQYADYQNNPKIIHKKYGKDILKIIKSYQNGKYPAQIRENGLLYIPDGQCDKTWMNESINGNAVSPRCGFVVEINALWYNALMFASALAETANDKPTVKYLSGLNGNLAQSFCDVFVNEKGRHLSDFVNAKGMITDSRPNQVFAVALPYSPLSDKKKQLVIESIEDHLLTVRGLRTLSPRNHKYRRLECSNEQSRKETKHQGAVFPWLFGLYAEAKLRLYQKSALYDIEKRYKKFEEVMHEVGLGTISEYYNGNPPYKSHGAVSYAPSVAEVRRVGMMIESYK